MSNANTSPTVQCGKPSIVEMAVFVILFLWIASLPSSGNGPRRPARADRHLSSRLHSRIESWLQTGLRGSQFGAEVRHLHACIAGPE